MKFNKAIIILFIVIFSVSNIYSQNDHKTVQKRISEIFELCKAEQFEDAAAYFVYSGSDKARDLKSKIDYKNRKEKSYVDRMCKKINSYLKISDNYEFGKSFSELEEWGIANKQEVSFVSENQQITTEFVFVKIKEEYLLAEIN